MHILVELTRHVIRRPEGFAGDKSVGAWLEFAGSVRGLEDGHTIQALEYEAYDRMAERVLRELLSELGARYQCRMAGVIHRLGVIPVGEAAIWVGVGSTHRQETLAFMTEFMDRLKQDVPIWKRRALTTAGVDVTSS